MLSPLITLAIYAILSHVQGGNPLSTAQAFTSISIIILVTNPVASLISIIPTFTSAFACFDRIEMFLLAQSREENRQTPDDSSSVVNQPFSSQHNESIELLNYTPKDGRTGRSKESIAVTMTSVTVSPAQELPPILHDIHLGIKCSSLSMIVGPIGSGKSTLLKVILGELPSQHGLCYVISKRMAYCPQEPWLPNMSVKQIVCGPLDRMDIDEEWYQTVMHACVLDQDMKQIPQGDQVLVGSRGLTLSGGQKQRLVSLAPLRYEFG